MDNDDANGDDVASNEDDDMKLRGRNLSSGCNETSMKLPPNVFYLAERER